MYAATRSILVSLLLLTPPLVPAARRPVTDAEPPTAHALALRTRNLARTPLGTAAYQGDMETVVALLATADINAMDNLGNSPLILAIAGGNDDIATLLINHGARVNEMCSWWFSPLMVAAMLGNQTITEILLARNASVHLKNDYGQTALSLATRNKHTSIAALISARTGRPAPLAKTYPTY